MQRGWARELLGAALLSSIAAAQSLAAPTSFVNFESGHVRPLALAGGLLFAVNTPDNRLSMFAVGESGLTRVAEVSVGMEPVAVAARNRLCLANGKCPIDAYVVNHLSDNITVLNLTYDVPNASVMIDRVDTINTCDEPRDIVLAGKEVKHRGPGRIFVTTARRGQNCSVDAKLLTHSVGRGLVQVFDTETRDLVSTLELFTDTPRALAATRDGKRVYAAGFFSGNRTTVLTEPLLRFNGGLPPPPQFATANAPNTGLIIKYDPVTSRWLESELRPPATTPKDWTSSLAFTLPDYDVFAIDALATPPTVERRIAGVGTVINNMAIRPKWTLQPKPPAGASGRDQIFVTNTEALNDRRFEPRLRGHSVENRVTVISGILNFRILPVFGKSTPFGGWSFNVRPVHLNSHLDYTCLPPLCLPEQSKIDKSLALPNDIVFSSDGTRAYIAALGSGAVGVFDAEQLSQGNPTNRTVVRVGGGPSGLVLDETYDRLYVMDRFANAIVPVDVSTSTPAVAGPAVQLYDPSPSSVKNGRAFLYDAYRTSAHGDQACASCHVFGDLDGLAWDLGDPFGAAETNCNDFINAGGPNQAPIHALHPMKGPMTTQSLRGMADAGPLHWRGDRSGCGSVANQAPDLGQYDEMAAFKKFNNAFVSLLGRVQPLDASTGGEMDRFTTFALSMRYPPNPIRPFDGFSDEAAAGLEFFEKKPVDGAFTCADCHGLPLGTNAKSSEEGETQQFKVAHLRNLYQKVGRFGIDSIAVFGGIPASGPLGEQIKGFGILHDGSIDTVQNFLDVDAAFQFPTPQDHSNVTQLMFEFDTGLAPIVGQQITATWLNSSTVSGLDTLVERAKQGECDLIARGNPNPSLLKHERGFLYEKRAGDFGPSFYADSQSAPKQPPEILLQTIVYGGWLTFTCVPVGSGGRLALDRDCDSTLDFDETNKSPDPISYPSQHCP